MTVKMPYQCFINGQFVDADDGRTYDTINPTDGSVSHGAAGGNHAHVSYARSKPGCLFDPSASKHVIQMYFLCLFQLGGPSFVIKSMND